MDRKLSRRALLGALVGAGVGGAYLSPARGPLEQFSPLSGSVWESAGAGRQDSVETPHGPATVRYDDDGVPHVQSEDELGLYFAVGYTQATDRLFQMDLQRRLFRGELSAVVGDVALETDRFHRKMAFGEAAEVTAAAADGTRMADVIDAYSAGVNRAIEQETLPVEFKLLEYEPEPWQRSDTAIIEKLIAWQLTGDFQTLRRSLVRQRLTEEFDNDQAAKMADTLFPNRYDDVSPIIRDHHDVDDFTVGGERALHQQTVPDDRATETAPPGQELVDWLGQFESPRNLGSNSWVVGPEHTAGDGPLLANDPHLALQAPPTWYEMHVDGPDHRARGVTFPGAPVIVIGENDDGAWGFTNAGADVIDFYRYEHDGDTYQYGDERREFEKRTEKIEVDSAENETVEVKKTVHGPVVERAEQEVGVAWTGHTATETMTALYELSHSDGLESARTAITRFDCPTQNFVYADQDGNTLYYMTGRVPIRQTDGEVVRGDQVFDGSAPEGEWSGFEPFGESSWEGFVPDAAKPQVENPSYLGTANQQIVRDNRLDYYLSESYSSPFRGRRIYDKLDQRIAAGEPIDQDYLREIGRDTYDGRAERLVDPLVEAARESDDGRLEDAAAELGDWDYHLDPDSRAALVFDTWFQQYRKQLFEETFDELDLYDDYYPPDVVIAQLAPDSEWVPSAGRAQVMRDALVQTLDELDDEGHEVYGDVNHTGHIAHQLGLTFLGYPVFARGGGRQTVWNYGRNGPWGGSWEMQVDLDGDLLGVLPGGNSGRYFSEHYDDQLEQWANGEYRTLSRKIEGTVVTEFVEGDE
jgi:penicillin amidase